MTRFSRFLSPVRFHPTLALVVVSLATFLIVLLAGDAFGENYKY